MGVFITLLKNDAKIIFKDTKALILIFIMPILFILFFSVSLSPSLNKTNFVKPFNIALVDNENSAMTRIITNQIKSEEIFKTIYNVNEDTAKEMLIKNKVAGIIIIPNNFTDNLQENNDSQAAVIGNSTMPLESFIVKSFSDSAASFFSSAQSTLNTITHFNNTYKINITKDVIGEFALKTLNRAAMFSKIKSSASYNLTPIEYSSASLLAMFLIFAGFPCMKMLVTEKSIGITKRLLSAPVKIYQIILSKALISLILASIQFMIIIIITSLFFNSYWKAPKKDIFLLFISIMFAVSTFGVLISAISKKPSTSDILANLGVLLMAIIGGIIYPLSSMPDYIKFLSNFTINHWATQGFFILFSGNTSLSIFKYSFYLFLIGTIQMILSIIILKFQRRNI